MEFIGGLIVGVTATTVVCVWRNRKGLEQLEIRHRYELNSLRQTMAQDYELQIKTAVESVKSGQQSHIEGEIKAVSQRYEGQITGLTQAHQGAIAQLQREHQAALAALKARHQEDLAAFQPVTAPPAALSAPIPSPQSTTVQPLTLAPGDLNAALAQSDPQSRLDVATYLGELAAAAPRRAASEPWLNHLACLSQDADPQVRQAAIVGLSQVKSDRVIPWLTQSLKDQDAGVVQTAAAALNHFKFYAPSKNRPLPKNAAPQD
ncbi:MAG: hypothetical protein EA366_04565 [Spirulina sp. DLM2.Bin59]|nr:MAG: hypothetical protein EA366_04565 [Spirulina sp. DLM2.Bin59]